MTQSLKTDNKNFSSQKCLRLPKTQHKVERKKLVKLCHKKLQNIVDSEEILCKSVLINNTLRFCLKLGLESENDHPSQLMINRDLEDLFGEDHETDEILDIVNNTALPSPSMPILI